MGANINKLSLSASVLFSILAISGMFTAPLIPPPLNLIFNSNLSITLQSGKHKSLLIFGFFLEPILEFLPWSMKFIRLFCYSFCQIFQALRLFPALRLFRTSIYIVFVPYQYDLNSLLLFNEKFRRTSPT